MDDFNLDYFIILAHVDNNSGLFNECDGGLIKSLFSNEKIKERFIKDIDDICKYTPNNKIIIKYHDKNIENYSLGQRASAVLSTI